MPVLQRGPKKAVEQTLLEDWDNPRVLDARSWSHESHFEASRWIHTGWYDDSNPNPQITVSGVRELTGSPTGWTSMDPRTGEPTAWTDGQVYADVWVSDRTGGVNPKLYGEELARRIELVIGLNYDGTTYNGEREFHRLGTGETREPGAPAETPVDHRFRVPVLYGYRRTLP